MGNCYSIQSKKLKEKTEPSCSKPFFRQKGLVNIRRDHIYSCRDEWKKRQPLEKVFGSLSADLKERVLDKEPTGGRGYFTDDTESHTYSLSHDSYRYFGSEIKSIPTRKETGDVWEKRQSFQKKVLGSYSAVIRETVFDKEQTGEVDHYDRINESEIRSLPEKKIKRKLPPPPPVPQEPGPPQTEQDTTAVISSYPNSASYQSYTESSEISDLVKIFRPLIINNLLVSEVLPYLPFLENHDDLYQEVKANKPKDVAESLLVALHESKEPRKWQKFINVLNECGYTYIVENIRGYTFANHFYQREYLKTITPKICKMINPAELIPHLLAENLISDTDKENIQQEKANFGDIQSSVLLLDRITRKNENWYNLFIKVLQEAGKDDIAADLMISELIQNPRKKVKKAHQSDEDVCYHLPPYPLTRSIVEEPSQKAKAEVQTERSNGGIEGETLPLASSTDMEIYDIHQTYINEAQSDPPITQLETCDIQPEPISIVRRKPPRKVPQKVYGHQNQIACTDDNEDEIYDEMEYETYEDNFTEPTERIVNNAHVTIFQDLKNDIENLKWDKKNIILEVELQNEKFVLNEEINIGLRKLRELRKKTAMTEKERRALKSDCVRQDDTYDSEDIADKYCPTKWHNERKMYEPSVLTKNWTKCTLDYRPLCHFDFFKSLELSSPSVVQLFSPNFSNKSKISRHFELDSGIGN